MMTCPVCQFEPFVEEAGPCPRCALVGALALSANAGGGGDYEILDELGRGGMGVVSLARQRSLERLVALKVIGSGGADLESRLQREARSAAAIQHPNVVAVHEVGRGPQGMFIAMEYCEGGDLRGRLRQGLLSARATALMGVRLADALAAAHASGVLHRDLKPSNVLLTPGGEPKLTDFGLSSSLLGATGDVTIAGEIAGSPSYLAPETLQPGQKPAATVDVYGLGAVLYECVTGRAPFVGETAALVLAQVAGAEPVPARKLSPGLPLDLDTIIMKCLERSPAARYASAVELRDDLQRYLDGRPIRARPLSAAGRTSRWARRNPALAACLGLIFVGSLAGALVLAERNRRLSAALADSEQAKATANEALHDSLLAQARNVRLSGRVGQRHDALRLIREAVRVGGFTGAARSEALAALMVDDWRWQPLGPPLQQLRANNNFGFDERLEHFAVPGADGQTIEIRRLADQALVRRLQHDFSSPPLEIEFRRSDGHVAVRFDGGVQAVWGPRAEKPSWQHTAPQKRYTALALADDESGWWFSTRDNSFFWHDAAAQQDSSWGAAGEFIYEIAPSPRGRLLALTREDGLEVWSLETKQLVWKLRGDYGYAKPVWTPDGSAVVSERYSGFPELVALRATDGEVLSVMRGRPHRVYAMALFPDARRLLTINTDNEMILWDIVTGRELVRGPAGPHGVAVSKDGMTAAGAMSPEKLARIDLAGHGLLHSLRFWLGSSSPWQSVAKSHDGRLVAVLKFTRFHVLDAESGVELGMQVFPAAEMTSISFAPDGRIVVSARRSGFKIFRPRVVSGRMEFEEEAFSGNPAGYHVLEINSRGDWLLAHAESKQCMVWPQGLASRERGLGEGLNGQLSWDGQWAIVLSQASDAARLIHLADGSERATLHLDGVARAKFSNDGRWLVLEGDKEYRVIDTARPEAVWHDIVVAQADPDFLTYALAEDGKWLAYLSARSTVTVFDLNRRSVVADYALSDGVLPSFMIWSSDSKRLFLFSGYAEIQELRPFAADRLLQEAGFPVAGQNLP